MAVVAIQALRPLIQYQNPLAPVFSYYLPSEIEARQNKGRTSKSRDKLWAETIRDTARAVSVGRIDWRREKGIDAEI